MKKTWIAVVSVVGVATVVAFLRFGGEETSEASDAAVRTTLIPEKTPSPRGDSDVARSGEGASAETEAATGDGEAQADEPQTEEEKKAAAEEAKVEAFDALTDKWMEPSETPVTMKDVETFVAAFRQVPKGRRDECVHRALNLVPDENVMLLAGILMDKTMDGETVETVFNDILNRDETVKKPILEQVFKDKSHACYADAAWILDVTGETPKGSSK